jgi:hypothetical protein
MAEVKPWSFEVFDEGTNSWTRPVGEYRIYVGASSRDLPLRAPIRVR